MRLAVIALLCAVAATAPVMAQSPMARGQSSELEFRPSGAVAGEQLELQLPDVASGRTQRRPITDLMVRLSLPGGDVVGALRLSNGATVDRDAGLFRADLYVVSGGRLLLPAEARCDRWIDDFAVCTAVCDGGVFGLRRRGGAGPVNLTMVVGRLTRGLEEGARPGFSLNACDAASALEQVLAPAGNRSLAEIALRAP